jgi:tetratricopeptide (TPR) repeat protein
MAGVFLALAGPAYGQDTLFESYLKSAGEAYVKKSFKEAEKLYRLAVKEGEGLGLRDKRMVQAHYWLARTYSNNAKNDTAEEHFLKAAEMARKTLPARDELSLLCARSLAACYIDNKKFAKAEPYVTWLTGAYEKEKGQDSAEAADAHFLVGLTYKGMKKVAEAEKAFRRAIAAEEARDKTSSWIAASCHFHLADVADTLKKDDAEALTRFAKAARRWEQYGKGGLDTAVDCLSRMAAIHSRNKKPEQAAKVYAQIEDLFRKIGADGKGGLGRFHHDRAWAELGKGSYKEAAAFANKVIDLYESLPEGHSNQAYAHVVLARIDKAQSRPDAAARAYERAVKIITSLHGPDHLDTAWVQYDYADFLADRGKHAEAIKFAGLALATREKKLGPKSLELAPVLATLSVSYAGLEKWPDALEAAEKLIKLREDVQGKDHVDLAWALRQAAFVREKRGEKEAAEKLLKRALDIREKKYGAGSAEATYDIQRLARFYQAQGRPAEAETLFRKALAEREKVLGKDHPDLAPALSGLAGFLVAEGKYDEAEKLLKQAVANREKNANSRELAASIDGLAYFYFQLARYSDAIALYKRSLAIHEKTDGPRSRAVANALRSLWWPYSRAGRHAEVLPLARRAVRILEDLGIEDESYASALNTVASAEGHQRNYAAAETAYRKALAIYEKSKSTDNVSVAVILNNLGNLLSSRDELSEAEELLKRSIAIKDKAGLLSGQSVAERLNRAANLARSHANLAGVYRTLGLTAEAESHARKALAIREEHLGKAHPDLAGSLSQLAFLAEDRGEYAKAEAMLGRAAAIRARAFKEGEAGLTVNDTEAAHLHWHHGRFTEADRAYQKAEAVLDKLHSGDALEMAWLWQARGGLARVRGRYAEADKLLRKALDHYAGTAEGRSSHASALLDVAALEKTLGDYEAATKKRDRALAIYEKIYGKDHFQLAGILQPQLELDLTLGHLTSARARLDRILEWREKKGRDNPELISSREVGARLALLEGKPADAIKELDATLAARARIYGGDHYGRFYPLALKARALLRSDKLPDAEKAARESLGIIEGAYGDKHPETAVAELLVARVLIARGDLQEADKLITAARAIIDKRPARHPDRADLAWTTARLAAARKSFPDAERAYAEALEIRDRLLARDHPDTKRLAGELAAVLTTAGKAERARELLARAK